MKRVTVLKCLLTSQQAALYETSEADHQADHQCHQAAPASGQNDKAVSHTHMHVRSVDGFVTKKPISDCVKTKQNIRADALSHTAKVRSENETKKSAVLVLVLFAFSYSCSAVTLWELHRRNSI